MSGLIKKILGRIRFFPLAAYASWLTETAFDFAAEGNNDQAKVSLDAAKKYAGFLTKEGQVLEIYLLYHLAEYDKAVTKINDFECLNKPDDLTALKGSEINYLLAYLKLIRWAICVRRGESHDATPRVRRESINLELIRQPLKDKFPLVNHVDWMPRLDDQANASDGVGIRR